MKRTVISPFFVKFLWVILVLTVWELVGRAGIFPSFIFPSVTATLAYVIHNADKLLLATSTTLKMLLLGVALSCAFGLLITFGAYFSKKVRAIVEVSTSFLNSIPSITVLPFAILWFGLGERPIMFVTTFGAFCPFLLNSLNGVLTVDPILVDAARVCGADGLRLFRKIIFPLSLPSVITGFKSAWGVGWRSVVAAELVFGAVGGKGGLGWLIYMNRFQLNAAGMVASLLCIALIGIFTENIVLEYVERKTVKEWGMKRK